MENLSAFSIKYMHFQLSESAISLATFMLVKGRPMHAKHLLPIYNLYVNKNHML